MQTRVRYLCVDHVLAIKWFQMPSEQYAISQQLYFGLKIKLKTLILKRTQSTILHQLTCLIAQNVGNSIANNFVIHNYVRFFQIGTHGAKNPKFTCFSCFFKTLKVVKTLGFLNAASPILTREGFHANPS